MAAPMQALTEIGLGILLVIGLLTRPAAFVAFLYLGSLWVSEWGTAWIWELLVPVLAVACARGRTGRSKRGASTPCWRGGGHRLHGGELSHPCMRVSVVIPTHNEAAIHRPRLSGSAARSLSLRSWL